MSAKLIQRKLPRSVIELDARFQMDPTCPINEHNRVIRTKILKSFTIGFVKSSHVKRSSPTRACEVQNVLFLPIVPREISKAACLTRFYEIKETKKYISI